MSLQRDIGRGDLVALVINVVIGAGVLGLPAVTYGLLGTYSVAAWILCALIVGLVAACFAEVGSRFTSTGGAYFYAYTAFGPATGFMVGWLSWCSRLFSFATILNLAVVYGTGITPALAGGPARLTGMLATTAALTVAVLIGVRRSAHVNNALTALKVLVLVGFVIVGLPFIEVDRFVVHDIPALPAWQSAVLLMTFAFLGIESSVNVAGEMRDPRRDVPFALAAGLLVIALLYILIQVVCVGTIPDLAGSQRPMVDAAARFAGPVGGQFVAGAALIMMFGTLFAVLLTGSRLPFALAEQGQLPPFLARCHERFHTPHAAILLTGVLGGLLAIYSSFLGALIVTALTRLVGYLTTCAALVVLRRRAPADAKPAFSLPGGTLIAALALLACAWLILASSRAEFAMVLVLSVLGVVIGGGYAMFRRSATPATNP